MVNKSIIYKTFTDIIDNKCSQHLTLNKNIIKTFNNFADKTRSKKRETAIITDDKGVILDTVKGNKDSVNIEASLVIAWYEHGRKPLHIDHNHPNKNESYYPTQLSPADIDKVIDKYKDTGEFMVRSITCEDSFNHSRMTLVRGDNYDSKKNGHDFHKADMYMLTEFYGKFNDITFKRPRREKFEELWDNIKDKPPVNSKEYNDLMNKVNIEACEYALQECGYYTDLKKVQGMFRKANCKLTFEWVE